MKLLDFGAARNFMADSEKSMSVILKPGFAPVEAIPVQKENREPWTDVYGLSATMYRAITGEVPPDALDRMSGDVIKRPKQLGVKMEPVQETALMKGLELLIQNRFSSVREMEQALFNPNEVIVDIVTQEFGPMTFFEFILTEVFSALILVALLLSAAFINNRNFLFAVMALLTAPAYMTIIIGLHKKGVILLSYVVPIISYWVMGSRSLCVWLVIAGIVGEVLAGKTHWKNYKILALTHVIYNMVVSGFSVINYYMNTNNHNLGNWGLDVLLLLLTAVGAVLGVAVMKLPLKRLLKQADIK